MTQAEFIVLDTSPPGLELLLLMGSLVFAEDRDLALNASYIFIHGGGHLQVGTEQQPSGLATADLLTL